jgi:hypothetical protein
MCIALKEYVVIDDNNCNTKLGAPITVTVKLCELYSVQSLPWLAAARIFILVQFGFFRQTPRYCSSHLQQGLYSVFADPYYSSFIIITVNLILRHITHVLPTISLITYRLTSKKDWGSRTISGRSEKQKSQSQNNITDKTGNIVNVKESEVVARAIPLNLIFHETVTMTLRHDKTKSNRIMDPARVPPAVQKFPFAGQHIMHTLNNACNPTLRSPPFK